MSKSAAKQTLVSDFLNEDDYKELGHSLVLRNDTSGISFLDSSSISIVELKEDSLCLKLPENICQMGHVLTFIIFTSPLKKKFQKFPNIDTTKGLPIIGKVIELEKVNDSILIELKFTQFKEKAWLKIIGQYKEQQGKIESLISEVKK
jgi:hypothetical protein